MKKTAFITHPDCLLHEMGQTHPESPQRLRAIEDALHEAQLFDFLKHIDAPLASREDLEAVHDADYIDFLSAQSPQTGYLHLDMETAMNPSTLSAACRAAGAVVHAVDLIIDGQVDNAFCCVRPPGHHAERNQAMGFCFFNNIAVGAAHALTKQNISRVAILDFDVHHGNGTENIFCDDPRVLICSTFQHRLYPDRDHVENHPRIVNAPLQPGNGSRSFREAVSALWVPAVEAFKPEFIFVSAGFDAHWLDPMAELNLKDSDFDWVTRTITGLADLYCEGRLVSCLEGGYDVHALSASAVQHVRALMGI